MWGFSTDTTSSKSLVWEKNGDIGTEILINQNMVSAHNDKFCISVIGNIRPYGKSNDKPEELHWLLALLESSKSPEEMIGKISGFFILIIGTRQTGEINIYNDHLGTIPLYWTKSKQVLLISTTLKKLKSKSTKISNQAIYNYFYFHCIPAPNTLYEGISKLLPGSRLSMDGSGKMSTMDVYQPRYEYSGESSDSLHKQCREVISKAVSWNTSENCGAFLSGGLDSSTVSGMLAKNEGKAKTFSIGFNAKGYDETEYALITAKHFNTEHKTHYLEPAEILNNFTEVAAYFDEPFGNSSAMAAYICAEFAKKHGVDTLLAGDGGDEIFAGNERYVTQKIFDVYGNMPSLLRGAFDLIFDKSPLGAIPILSKGRSYIRQARVKLPDRLQTYNFLNRLNVKDMFTDEFFASVDSAIPSNLMGERYDACPSELTLEKLLYLDWKFTLADNDLVKVSQMCEKAGVAVNYPLLEKEVVDFSCTISAEQKLPGVKLRDFFKKSFAGFLADETINKSKHGFGLPFGVWMIENPKLAEMTHTYLEALRKRNIIKSEFIDKALEIFRSGSQGYYGVLIWIMLVLEVWLQKNEDIGL